MSGERPLHAAVLSGGGADGAYAVGVLKALCSGRSPAAGDVPLEPDIFTGTSIGAFNAAFLASQWDEYGTAAVGNLEDVWLNRLASGPGTCGNGVYRIRGNPQSLLNPTCYLPNPLRPFRSLATDSAAVTWDGLQRFVYLASASESLGQRLLSFIAVTPFVDTEPMERLLREVIDFRLIRRSSRKLRIVATNWTTGKLELFENTDMTDNTGPLVVAASAAIPGFFPPVSVGAQPYVDGSALMNTPLRPAIRAGASTLHVVYLDPEVRAIPISQLSNFPEAYYRLQQIAWANNVNDDIRDAQEINVSLALAGRAARQREVGDEDARDFFDGARRLFAQVEGSRSPLRQLTIRRYRPRDPLSGVLGLLNFDRDRIAALIKRGFDDTVNHNPEASRDVLPLSPEDPAPSDGPPTDEDPTVPASTN